MIVNSLQTTITIIATVYNVSAFSSLKNYITLSLEHAPIVLALLPAAKSRHIVSNVLC